MATSKSQQKATNKYIAKAYDRVNLTLPKGQKEIVQTHAAACGESVNGFIGRAISETMERDSPTARADAPPDAAGIQSPGAPQNATQPSSGPASTVPGIPPEKLEQVQAHIVKTGEDEAEFFERAVGEQIARDRTALKLGINPAAKKER